LDTPDFGNELVTLLLTPTEIRTYSAKRYWPHFDRQQQQAIKAAARHSANDRVADRHGFACVGLTSDGLATLIGHSLP
jgi:hypothetical protein